VIWLLKKHLKSQGIDLVYQEHQRCRQNTYEFTRLFMLSANVPHIFWEITFRST
jgi:hypothetical protein